MIKKFKNILARYPFSKLRNIRHQDIGETHTYTHKSAKEYFNELTHLAKTFDVNSLKVDDEYVWPYLRNRLWIQLFGISNNKMDRMNFPSTAVQKGSFRDLPLSSRNKLKSTFSALEIDDIDETLTNVDFLFLTVINSSEQTLLESGEIYHRITDPFYEIAKKVGTAKKIEILKVKSKAIEKSVNYRHKVTHILTPTIFRHGYVGKIKFSNFLSQLKKHIPSLNHNGLQLRESIDWELHTRDFYIELLQKINPKIVLLNGFHYQAPLISACHSLNITSVDIQHGIQVGWNPLYNNWNEMPQEGYQGVPNHFFVWGRKELFSINKVFTGTKHLPILTGFPWLEKQLELTDNLQEKYIQKFNKYRVKVLLVLQKQPEVPKLFKDLIENSPDDYLWIIRHHPKGSKFTLKDFTSSSQKNVLTDKYIDNVTLPHIFKHVNIAVSEGSTVASEADYFGLYNFIFSSKGRSNYVKEIKDGHFFYINKYQEFYSKIKILDLTNKISRANLYEKVNIENVFEELLMNKKRENEK